MNGIHKPWWTQGTAANWQPCKAPAASVEYTSESGSQYVTTLSGVYRRSDHWGQVSTCRWLLADNAGFEDTWAFCPWKGFVRFHSIHCGQGAYVLQPGDEASVLHAPRDRRGQVQPERVRIMVVRVTADFVIDSSGKRYAKSTLRSVFLQRSAA
jgi:hypothetical protein